MLEMPEDSMVIDLTKRANTHGSSLRSMVSSLIGSKEPPMAPQAAMGFFTDTSLCIGCKACEIACKQWNQLPASDPVWTGSSYDNTGQLSATTWRHVLFIEQFSSRATAIGGKAENGDQTSGRAANNRAGASPAPTIHEHERQLDIPLIPTGTAPNNRAGASPAPTI